MRCNVEARRDQGRRCLYPRPPRRRCGCTTLVPPRSLSGAHKPAGREGPPLRSLATDAPRFFCRWSAVLGGRCSDTAWQTPLLGPPTLPPSTSTRTTERLLSPEALSTTPYRCSS